MARAEDGFQRLVRFAERLGQKGRAWRFLRQPAGWSAVACVKKRQIASVASGPRGSV
jgi:hypothetical protein